MRHGQVSRPHPGLRSPRSIAAAVSGEITLPTVLATYAGVDSVIKLADGHVHVERASAPNHVAGLRATLPRLQPRDDDLREFATKRAYTYGGAGPISLWPSE